MTVSYPLLPTALASERIADLHRAATRRRTVLAALLARHQRRAAPRNPDPSTQATSERASMTEHLCDAARFAADAGPIPQRESSDLA